MKTRTPISIILLATSLAWSAAPALRAQASTPAELRGVLATAEQQLERAQQQVPVLERRKQDRVELKAAYEGYRSQLQPEWERLKTAHGQYVFYLERVVAQDASNRDSQIESDKRRVDPQLRAVSSRWGGWLGVVPDWYAYGAYGSQYVAAEKELEARRSAYYQLKDRLNREIRYQSGLGVGELPPPRDYDSLEALAKEQEGVLATITTDLARLGEIEIPELQRRVAALRSELRAAERDERERAERHAQPPDPDPVVVYEGAMSVELQKQFQQLIQQDAKGGVTVTRDDIRFSPMRLKVLPREGKALAEPVSASFGVGTRATNPAEQNRNAELDASATLVFSAGKLQPNGRITGTYTSHYQARGSGSAQAQTGSGTVEIPWRAEPEGGLPMESGGVRLPTSYLVHLGTRSDLPAVFRLQCRGSELAPRSGGLNQP